jgi:putative phosphoesterase
MKRIGLISDTHSYLDPSVFKYFKNCDEIWHAGDIGAIAVADQLEAFRPLKAVFGNIDDQSVRQRFPEDLIWECEGLSVFMTHIGGYPGRYKKRIIPTLKAHQPGLYICGHSHILKVMPDPRYKLLHINPGAAGHHGFHKMRTIIRFVVEAGTISGLEVIELGKRGQL